jgi:AraC-like DNA-binding protein
MTVTQENVMHTVQERRALPALAQHVACTWIQAVSPESSAFTHRKSPNGSVELVCAAGSMPRIVGPQTGPIEEELVPGTTIVGVRLRPEAAASVLGVATNTLLDLGLEADELWGDRARALQERIALAKAPQHAVAHLERAVADRLPDAPDPVVAEAVRRLMSARRADVGSMAASLFISERQLRRRFQTATGLTPTKLHRMLRFQRFLALAWTHENPRTHLAQLALEAGYADQAHLSRDAARLEGRPPGSFLPELERRCGCGHDHSASYAPLLRHRM